MMGEDSIVSNAREPVLSPVDRVSEMLFGLFMALTFVGAVSVAESGDAHIRAMFIAALGCNLAWGLVDAVMYLVRTVTDRGRLLTLIRSVRDAPDAATGRLLIEHSLSRVAAGPAVMAMPAMAGDDDHYGRRASPPAKPSWEFALTAYPTFPRGGDDYVTAIAAADRGPLHFEARYNYESIGARSAFVGWTLS